MTTDLRIENVHVFSEDPVVSPDDLKSEFPLSESNVDMIREAHDTINAIVQRQDPRILMVVGPCSIHDVDAARDYAKRLSVLAQEVSDTLYIVMRVYFEKPRTRVGWQGLINDPHLDGSADIEQGLRLARHLLLDVAALKLPVAGEALDIVTPQYVQDLISWTAIGARTTESQSHRKMASGFTCAVGFKNSTDGTLDAAVNAIHAASHPQNFLSVNPAGTVSVVRTKGNPNCHVVLRGGASGPNYDAAAIGECIQALQSAGLPANIMVDCSHANSGKAASNQVTVLQNLATQIANGDRAIMGVMIESNINHGNQPLVAGSPLKYGVSITDECLGWDETQAEIREFANSVKSHLPTRT